MWLRREQDVPRRKLAVIKRGGKGCRVGTDNWSLATLSSPTDRPGSWAQRGHVAFVSNLRALMSEGSLLGFGLGLDGETRERSRGWQNSCLLVASPAWTSEHFPLSPPGGRRRNCRQIGSGAVLLCTSCLLLEQEKNICVY